MIFLLLLCCIQVTPGGMTLNYCNITTLWDRKFFYCDYGRASLIRAEWDQREAVAWILPVTENNNNNNNNNGKVQRSLRVHG